MADGAVIAAGARAGAGTGAEYVVNLVGQITLRQTAAVLAQCRLLVANDSAPAHLATAVGVPTLELSTHPVGAPPEHDNAPERWAPLGTVLQPVALPGCEKGCVGALPHCILGIETSTALAAARHLLSIDPNRLQSTPAGIFPTMTSDTLASALQRRVDNAQVLVTLGPGIAAAADIVSEALRNGHQVLLFGNGGSAADAQHIAAEMVGRFVRERRGFPAAALTTDSSILTAVANDYGFEQIFARQVSATGGPGDVAIGISTSGRSENVLAGVQAAIDAGMRTIGLSGRDGGALASLGRTLHRGAPGRDVLDPRVSRRHRPHSV